MGFQFEQPVLSEERRVNEAIRAIVKDEIAKIDFSRLYSAVRETIKEEVATSADLGRCITNAVTAQVERELNRRRDVTAESEATDQAHLRAAKMKFIEILRNDNERQNHENARHNLDILSRVNL